MKAGKRIVIGCLFIVLLGVIGLVSTVGVMATLDPPESKREVIAQDQELKTPRWNQADNVNEGGTVPQQVDLFLDLHEGEFEILPGNPGEGIRIEADYDSGVYALEQIHSYDQDAGEDSTENVKIRFRSRYSMLRRLMSKGNIKVNNELKIYLPPDIPIRLRGDISIGESDLDLTGIPLTGLDLKLTLGEHHISIDEPNPLKMDTAKIYASKGEFDLDGMGNAHFESLDVKGSMGELSVDMTGDYTQDSALKTRFRMGEVRVLLPDTVKLEVKQVKASMGEARSTITDNPDLPEDAPVLRVDTSISMGELRVGTPRRETKESEPVEVVPDAVEPIAEIEPIGEVEPTGEFEPNASEDPASTTATADESADTRAPAAPAPETNGDGSSEEASNDQGEATEPPGDENTTDPDSE